MPHPSTLNTDWSQLDARLKAIVEDELTAGNAVYEVTKDAFPNCPLFVFMRQAFKLRHEDRDPSVVFDAINDPHYWKAEYRVKVKDAADVTERDLFHTVACPF